jgi:hypothetical protein
MPSLPTARRSQSRRGGVSARCPPPPTPQMKRYSLFCRLTSYSWWPCLSLEPTRGSRGPRRPAAPPEP